MLRNRRLPRMLGHEVPANRVVDVSGRLAIGREVDLRHRKIAHPRIGEARPVSVVRRRDDVVGHPDLDAARIGGVVDGIGRVGRPRLAHTQQRVVRKALRSDEERPRRIEPVGVSRLRGHAVETGMEIGDIAEEWGSRDHQRRAGLGDDRSHGNDRSRQRVSRPQRLRRLVVDARKGVGPANDHVPVGTLEAHDSRGRHVRLAGRRTEAAQTARRDRRLDEILAELRCRNGEIDFAVFVHDRDEAGRDLGSLDECIVRGRRSARRRRRCGTLRLSQARPEHDENRGGEAQAKQTAHRWNSISRSASRGPRPIPGGSATFRRRRSRSRRCRRRC